MSRFLRYPDQAHPEPLRIPDRREYVQPWMTDGEPSADAAFIEVLRLIVTAALVVAGGIGFVWLFMAVAS